MLFREFQPPSCLKPYVRYYWILQLNPFPALHSGTRLLTESFELTFNLAAPVEIVNCEGRIKSITATGITGPMSRPMRLRSNGPVDLFGVCFRPGGGYPFFRYPTHELLNQYPDVDDLWGAGGREFVEHIQNDCPTTQSRIEAVNAYLINRLKFNHRDNLVTQKAIETIESCKGSVTIDQLARHLGLSCRQLTRIFRERIGMTPKQLCRNTRFKQVYKVIENSSHHHWAEVALDCGYYDQSHFINEFKHFTGSSPDAYFYSSPHGPDFFTANF